MPHFPIIHQKSYNSLIYEEKFPLQEAKSNDFLKKFKYFPDSRLEIKNTVITMFYSLLQFITYKLKAIRHENEKTPPFAGFREVCF